MTAPRRSRRAWPGPLMTTAGVGKGHAHSLTRTARVLMLLLTVYCVAMALVVGITFYRSLLAGDYRDGQVKQIQEQIRQGQCDLLDTFPEGLPALKNARTKYGCGPGIPFDKLPPELQSQIEAQRPPVTVPAPTGVLPDDPWGGASPNPYRVPANEPPD